MADTSKSTTEGKCTRCGLTGADWQKHKHLPMTEANPMQFLHWENQRLMPYKQTVDLALTERQYNKAIGLAMRSQASPLRSTTTTVPTMPAYPTINSDAAGGGGCLWFGCTSSSKRVPKRLIPLSKWENRLHRAKKEGEYLFDRQQYRKVNCGVSQVLISRNDGDEVGSSNLDNNIEWWKRFDKFIKLWKIVMTTCAIEKWGGNGVGSQGGGVRPLRVRHASSTSVNYHQDFEIDDDYDYSDHRNNDCNDCDQNGDDESRTYRTSWSSLKAEADFAKLAANLSRGEQKLVDVKGEGEVESRSDMTWYAGITWEEGWMDVKHPLQQPSDSRDHSRQVWLTPTVDSSAEAATK